MKRAHPRSLCVGTALGSRLPRTRIHAWRVPAHQLVIKVRVVRTAQRARAVESVAADGDSINSKWVSHCDKICSRAILLRHPFRNLNPVMFLDPPCAVAQTADICQVLVGQTLRWCTP